MEGGEEQGLPNRGHGEEVVGSRLHLTDVTIEYSSTDSIGEDEMAPGSLCVFGLDGAEDNGKLFPLVEFSKVEWKLEGPIETPSGVDAVNCIVKSNHEEDIGWARLDGLRRVDSAPDQERSTTVEACNGTRPLHIRWGTTLIPSGELRAGSGVITLEQLEREAIGLYRASCTSGSLSRISGAIEKQKALVDGTPKGDARRQRRLSNLGCFLVARFEFTGGLEDMAEAITAQAAAVRLTPEASPELPSFLTNLGNSFSRRFGRTGDVEDLKEAISMQTRAVGLTSQDHPCLPLLLLNLGNSLSLRFERTGDLQDITEAIERQATAVRLAPEGNGGLPTYLNNLGNSFARRFEHIGDLQDITEAIARQEMAIGLTDESNPDLPSFLSNLGNSLFRRFERTGNLQDATEAIAKQEASVSLTPEDHPDLPTHLSNLGNSFSRRFERTGDLEDITKAITVAARAVNIAPEDHANLAPFLGNLGNSFLRRFEHGGDLQDLTEAISNQKRATSLTPEGHADLPSHLSDLGTLYWRKFERTGDLDDLSEAISCGTRAVRLTQDDHSKLAYRLANLGNFLSCRFERQGMVQDIVDAISEQRRAVNLTAEGNAQLPGYLGNLAASFLRQFGRTGNVEDITQAIAMQNKAIALLPGDDAGLPSYYNNLGICLARRFERTGDLQDIAEAITSLTKAVSFTPDGHADMPGFLTNLGTFLWYRFDRAGDLHDIRDAITTQKKAISLTPAGHASLASRYNNLGAAFSSQFEHTKDLQDIIEAIACHTRTTDLTTEDDAELPTCLSNLGNALMLRFESTGQIQDITKAIELQEKAISLLPEGHTKLPLHLNNLGTSFLARFEGMGDLQDLSKAIEAQTQAIGLAQDAHAAVPPWLFNLGNLHLQYYKSCMLQKHLDISISSFRSAANHVVGSPHVMMDAASQWATLLDEHRPHNPEVLTAFDTTIRLLTSIVGLDQTVQRRHTIIQAYASLALRAASTAVQLEHPEKAVEWLEQGRCLVWGQQSHLRTPLDALYLENADLTGRLKSVSGQLESAGLAPRTRSMALGAKETMLLENQARHHLQLAQEWENILKEVRAIPGFESFLQPTAFEALIKHLPSSGPVVLVNVHATRCDAIVLVAGQREAKHIPLPKFSLTKADELHNALTAVLESDGLRQRAEVPQKTESSGSPSERALRPPGYRPPTITVGMKDILERLWVEVVKPILDALDLLRQSPELSTQLPRVWWCPTGPLSFLPLHAAGIYSGSTMEGASDYVVSSYTPTITALIERVQAERYVDDSVSGILLTCQPNAPGTRSIPGTRVEVRSIYDRAAGHGIRCTKLEGADITSEGCLKLMEEFSSIHLACHASQNAAEPLRSRFRFHTDNLTLEQIMRADLKNADLAFLSACETSTGEEKLSDEAVHLAAGMLAAGYRRVVATMWRIGDAEASKVANDFYQYLLDHREGGSGARFDGAQSAYALHHATRKLRGTLKNTDSSLLAWVPFVHFGY